MTIGRDERRRAALAMVAPGTALRDGLERIVRGNTGALIVLGLFIVNAEDGYNLAAMPFNIGWWSLGLYLCTYLIWGVYGSAAAGGRNGWRAVGAIGLAICAVMILGASRREPITLDPRLRGELKRLVLGYLRA